MKIAGFTVIATFLSYVLLSDVIKYASLTNKFWYCEALALVLAWYCVAKEVSHAKN